MPLYEYRCGDCQARFEILQRMGEGAEGLACPSCGGSELVKEFSTFAATSAGNGARRSAGGGGCGSAGGTGFT